MSCHRIQLLAVCVALLASGRSSPMGYYCSLSQTTMRDDIESAHYIAVGTLANARTGPNGDGTDLMVTQVIKNDPALAGQKVILIPRYLPQAQAVIAFADVFNGSADIYRGIPATPALVEYVKGLSTIAAKDRRRLMRYCFDYLQHEDPEIANDAHKEFKNSSDDDVRIVARTLPADKLRRWLKDDTTLEWKLGLYAQLLENCGNQDDAAMLRNLLEKFLKRGPQQRIGFSPILNAYTRLKPAEGWAYTCTLLKQQTAPFWVRHSALRTAQHYYTNSPGVVADKDILEAVSVLLEQNDIADLAVESIREWRSWQFTDRILQLTTRKGFNIPIIRRSVLRYALQCPDPAATALVETMRKSDPQRVRDAELLLKLEAERTQPGP